MNGEKTPLINFIFISLNEGAVNRPNVKKRAKKYRHYSLAMESE
jgi:hypothetical protein